MPSLVHDVRRFNRTVTEHIGVLHDHYLGRGLTLGQARLLWEIGSTRHASCAPCGPGWASTPATSPGWSASSSTAAWSPPSPARPTDAAGSPA